MRTSPGRWVFPESWLQRKSGGIGPLIGLEIFHSLDVLASHLFGKIGLLGLFPLDGLKLVLLQLFDSSIIFTALSLVSSGSEGGLLLDEGLVSLHSMLELGVSHMSPLSSEVVELMDLLVNASDQFSSLFGASGSHKSKSHGLELSPGGSSSSSEGKLPNFMVVSSFLMLSSSVIELLHCSESSGISVVSEDMSSPWLGKSSLLSRESAESQLLSPDDCNLLLGEKLSLSEDDDLSSGGSSLIEGGSHLCLVSEVSHLLSSDVVKLVDSHEFNSQ